jgi:two-component system phosphate regulon sensor histidine kinase PhoR
MKPTLTMPWSGLSLAVVGCGAIALLGGQPWLALAVFLLWAGSLWLTAAGPPEVEAPARLSGYTSDTMAELIEHSGTPMLMTERNRVTIANYAAREILGAHILGQDVRVALRHPEAIALADLEHRAEAVVSNLARRRDVWRISRQPLDDIHAVIELVDQSAEADIGRAHTDFVANASHELRTPLASIIGYVETLAEEADEPQIRARFLGIILREARRLQQLVDDLLSLSRVEAREHHLPSHEIELGKLVERAARDAAGPDRAARLIFALESELAMQADGQQLEQMVRNVVDNALKYGAEDGMVTVSLERSDEDTATFAVHDQGDGIPADHLPHLTRRFYRVDAGRSRASGGTGLGLALVKHIVERHRGRLDITSARGVGTTISIKLPLVSQHPPERHDTVTQV